MPNHLSCLGHSTEQTLLMSLLRDLLFCQVTSRALRNPPPSIPACSTIMTKSKSAFKSGLKQASKAHAQRADTSNAQRADASKLSQNTSGAATDTLGSSASRASSVPPTKLLFGSLDRSLNRFRYKHRYFQNVDDVECTYDNRSLGAQNKLII